MNPFISTLPVHPPAMKSIARRRLRNLVATVVVGWRSSGMLGGTRHICSGPNLRPDTCCWLAWCFWLCTTSARNFRSWPGRPRQVGCRHTFMSVSVRPFCVVLTWPGGFLERLPGDYPRRALRGDFFERLGRALLDANNPPRLTARRDGISLRTNPRTTQTGAEPRRAIGVGDRAGNGEQHFGRLFHRTITRLSGKTTGDGTTGSDQRARSANGCWLN